MARATDLDSQGQCIHCGLRKQAPQHKYCGKTCAISAEARSPSPPPGLPSLSTNKRKRVAFQPITPTTDGDIYDTTSQPARFRPMVSDPSDPPAPKSEWAGRQFVGQTLPSELLPRHIQQIEGQPQGLQGVMGSAGQPRIVVPRDQIKNLVVQTHNETLHQGHHRVYSILKTLYYWPNSLCLATYRAYAKRARFARKTPSAGRTFQAHFKHDD